MIVAGVLLSMETLPAPVQAASFKFAACNACRDKVRWSSLLPASCCKLLQSNELCGITA